MTLPVRRGELYRIPTRGEDPRRERVFIVVSRDVFLASNYSSALCVPVYSGYGGLPTEVIVGAEHGLKHESTARCDEVTSVAKRLLTNYVGSLTEERIAALDRALAVALGVDHLFDERF